MKTPPFLGNAPGTLPHSPLPVSSGGTATGASQAVARFLPGADLATTVSFGPTMTA